jgi:hypothetical protein
MPYLEKYRRWHRFGRGNIIYMKRSEGHGLGVGETPAEEQENDCEAEMSQNERINPYRSESTDRTSYFVPQTLFCHSSGLRFPFDLSLPVFVTCPKGINALISVFL